VPTYDYQCRACGTVTEVIHPMLEDGPSVCELCGGQLRRVLYPSGIIFKGSGFYRNDSRPSRSGSGGESETGAGSSDKAGATEGGAGKGSEASTGSTTADGGSSAKKATSTDASSS
jgi:putative FmdB family regulatory protein